ncbi:hypothetical protein M3649_19195 [Ureibacillus chungkukjangi]|uniref:hypothetical protein n=1 Tax=Ureibacillus chungkukjangi TaxID=1202712 RepID=UPI0020412CA1|nr:hypothetical protein [Ureibacillus chungkukjangi]MCM3390227.1 hypothetical protein [Ureibacillus chungkukjangi]
MTHRARYTISFLPTDTDLIKHLDNIKAQTTVSMYVRALIRKDLDNENTPPNIDDVVEKVMKKLNSKNAISIPLQSNEPEIKINEEQRSIITNLF